MMSSTIFSIEVPGAYCSFASIGSDLPLLISLNQSIGLPDVSCAWSALAPVGDVRPTSVVSWLWVAPKLLILLVAIMVTSYLNSLILPLFLYAVYRGFPYTETTLLQ